MSRSKRERNFWSGAATSAAAMNGTFGKSDAEVSKFWLGIKQDIERGVLHFWASRPMQCQQTHFELRSRPHA